MASLSSATGVLHSRLTCAYGEPMNYKDWLNRGHEFTPLVLRTVLDYGPTTAQEFELTDSHTGAKYPTYRWVVPLSLN